MALVVPLSELSECVCKYVCFHCSVKCVCVCVLVCKCVSVCVCVFSLHDKSVGL